MTAVSALGRLILILIVAAALPCRAEDVVSGRWEGTAQIPNNELIVVVDLAQENGAWIGSIIIPGLGLGVPGSISGIPNVFGLLGVVSGYMYETSDFSLRASTTWKGSLNANSGIAVVVPAQQLKDLLNSPDLQLQRDQTVIGAAGR